MLGKINQEIEDKDKQTAMIKEMLRASNQELKSKEHTVHIIKEKVKILIIS